IANAIGRPEVNECPHGSAGGASPEGTQWLIRGPGVLTRPLSFDEEARSVGHDAEVAGCVRVADASMDKRGSQRWTEVSGRYQRKPLESRESGEHLHELASQKSPFHLDREGGDRAVRC